MVIEQFFTPPERLAILGRRPYQILVGACRLAGRRNASIIETHHILESMSRWSPDLGTILGPFPSPEGESVKAVSAYPLDPSSAPPGSLQLEASGALRQAHWEVFGISAKRNRKIGGAAPSWSTNSQAAIERSLRIAGSRDMLWAGDRELLEALSADVDGAAGSGLRGHREDLSLLVGALDRGRRLAEGDPYVPIVDYFNYWGLLVLPATSSTHQRRARWASRAFGFLADASVVLARLEREAIVQAVRLGHSQVTPVHLLIAVAALEGQISATGARFLENWQKTSPLVLSDFSISVGHIASLVSVMRVAGPIVGRQRRRAWRTNPKNPAWTVAAARVADRARMLSAIDSQETGTLHILAALCEEIDDMTRRVLVELAVDPVEMRDDIATRLHNL